MAARSSSFGMSGRLCGRGLVGRLQRARYEAGFQPAAMPTATHTHTLARVAQVKWRTLEHAGVLFPPEYEPHGVRMLYDRVPVDLTPEEEEVATFFAVMKDTGALLCCVGGRRF